MFGSSEELNWGDEGKTLAAFLDSLSSSRMSCSAIDPIVRVSLASLLIAVRPCTPPFTCDAK